MIKIKLQKGYLYISKEIVVVLIFDLFTIVYYMSAKKLSAASMMFPTFLVIGILLFSVACFFQEVYVQKEITEKDGEAAGTGPGFQVSKKLMLFMIMSMVMLLLFEPLGAVMCIWLFLTGAMFLLDVRSKKILLLVPLIETIFIYLVFKVWLAVPLPPGILALLQ